MNFFQNLKLRNSQADALLNQLARQWEGEFDLLCMLLANSLVVHTDETSWSINSVWAFLTEKARVVLFGVHKDGATLQQILDPATFEGIVISDDAAVYAKFTHSQKCWAHLLRKAIHGARRRTVIVSVLESLRQYLPAYTLRSVIETVPPIWNNSAGSIRRTSRIPLGLWLLIGLQPRGCEAFVPHASTPRADIGLRLRTKRDRHLIRYYGWYSNKARDRRRKAAKADAAEQARAVKRRAAAGPGPQPGQPDVGHAHQGGVRDRPADNTRWRAPP